MVDLLVMDEVVRALQDRLLTLKDVLEIVKLRGTTHLVCDWSTRHPKELVEVADFGNRDEESKTPLRQWDFWQFGDLIFNGIVKVWPAVGKEIERPLTPK